MCTIKKLVSLSIIILTGLCHLIAQSNISFQCKELNLSKSETLKCDPVSEDDPDDLAEAYAYLVTFFPAGSRSDNQRFELNFPAHAQEYHWQQRNDEDKNDSLSVLFIYNTNPAVYGYTIMAHAKDFTINVTRYDAAKGGVIEGTFNGTMEAYLAWKQQTVLIPVKGSFHTTRTGKFSSECRKQRRPEKAVISEAVKIFEESLINPLRDLGWDVESEENGHNSLIANKPFPFRPVFLCSDFFHLKLSLNSNSAYGKMIQDSADYYLKQSEEFGEQFQQTNDKKYLKYIQDATMKVAYFQIMQSLEIKISGNEPYLKAPHAMEAKDKFTVLHIPGTSYACRFFKAGNEKLDASEFASLYFGNWTGADMNAKSYVSYPFVHKHQSPFIENISVTITAPGKIIDEVIKKIDWNKLNEAINK
jgi:hypothetical protein